MNKCRQTQILITNAILHVPENQANRGWILTENGIIADFGFGDAPALNNSMVGMDATGLNLLPGFIDIHIHGCNGFEVMDATDEAIAGISSFLVRHGVTSFLGATWSADTQAIRKTLDCIRKNLGPHPGGATLLGAYLEGPYLNPARAGAQDQKSIRKANPHELVGFLGTGVIRIIALAPEIDENSSVIQDCIDHHVIVAAGHTQASFEEIQIAVQKGVRLMTHCYNAMSPFNHREPGATGAALLIPEITCELIADNIHVHPAAIQLLYQIKGLDRILLISDAVRSAGLPEGSYMLDYRKVQVKAGTVRLEDGHLAGSTLTLDNAIKNFCENVGVTLSRSWQIVSLNQARLLGLVERKGSIEKGKDADLVLLDDRFNVQLTMVKGEIVYSNL